MTRDRVIGDESGGIPWHLPKDAAHFRAYTEGKHMLLGRKTFEEMNGWFTTQTPLILTSRENYRPSLGRTVKSVEEAIKLTALNKETELVVSGGAQVYAASLPFADRLEITIVEAEIESSVRFPDYLSFADWVTIKQEHVPADTEHSFAMTFLTLDRVRAS